jgi:hypothetical protein
MASFALLQPKAWHCRGVRMQGPEALDDAAHAMKHAMKRRN